MSLLADEELNAVVEDDGPLAEQMPLALSPVPLTIPITITDSPRTKRVLTTATTIQKGLKTPAGSHLRLRQLWGSLRDFIVNARLYRDLPAWIDPWSDVLPENILEDDGVGTVP